MAIELRPMPDPDGVDAPWRRMYTIGGICAVLYVPVAGLIPAAMTAAVSDFWAILVDPPALLAFIADHTLYWYLVQGAVLEGSILLIVAFAAVYLAPGPGGWTQTAAGRAVRDDLGRRRRCIVAREPAASLGEYGEDIVVSSALCEVSGGLGGSCRQ